MSKQELTVCLIVVLVVLCAFVVITNHQEATEWQKSASAEDRARAAAIEKELPTLERGNLIHMKDGRILFITRRVVSRGALRYCDRIGSLEGTLMPTDFSGIARKLPTIIHPGDGGTYDKAILEFTKQQ